MYSVRACLSATRRCVQVYGTSSSPARTRSCLLQWPPSPSQYCAPDARAEDGRGAYPSLGETGAREQVTLQTSLHTTGAQGAHHVRVMCIV